MQQINSFIKSFTPLIVLAVAALMLFVPEAGLWVQTAWINPLLMVVMFGMGLTMSIDDFKAVFTTPKDVLVGCVAQYAVMPLLAFGIGMALQLPTELLAGLVLVGTCPGGTASDVMTYLARGDVALSVSITAVNTLLAPILTPLVTLLYLQATVSVDVVSMFLSIVQVVIVPIVLGLALRKALGEKVDKAASALPLISVAAICLIIAAVVSHNSQNIFEAGAFVLVACVLLNLLGYAAGFAIAVATGMTPPRRKALSLEVGMQNSGLATTLAATLFPGLALAMVPGAVFSVWHNVSGAVLATWFRRADDKRS